MERLWTHLQRPLLAKVVAAYDRGVPIVDQTALAANLNEPAERIRAALAALQVAGFIEIQPHQNSLQITRVCPLARQVLGTASAPAVDPPGGI